MGISKTEREQLAKTGNERARFFTSSDEWGNNKVPYSWKTSEQVKIKAYCLSKGWDVYFSKH